MMADPLHFLGAHFGRANIHAPVHLHGVGGNNFTVHCLCKGNRQGRFSDSGRTCQDDEGRLWGRTACAGAVLNVESGVGRTFFIIRYAAGRRLYLFHKNLSLQIESYISQFYLRGSNSHYTIRLNLRSSSCFVITIIVGRPCGQ